MSFCCIRLHGATTSPREVWTRERQFPDWRFPGFPLQLCVPPVATVRFSACHDCQWRRLTPNYFVFEITIFLRFTSMSAGQTEIGLEYPSRNLRRAPRETASHKPDRNGSVRCGIRNDFDRIRASANEKDIDPCGQAGIGAARSLGSKIIGIEKCADHDRSLRRFP